MPPATIRKTTLDQKITEAGGPVPINVLAVCGDTMRRSKHSSSARPEETERALRALSVADVMDALCSVDASSIRTELTRSFEESFEAAFAENDEERTLFATSAVAALAKRDRVTSVLVAARVRAGFGGDDGADDLARLKAEIQRVELTIGNVDQELQKRSRSLTGINRERRAELEKLDVDQREGAWWYSDRSNRDDDTLLAALGDLEGTSAAKGTLSDLARADLANSASATGKLDPASSLRRASEGKSSAAEIAWLARAAQKNENLQRAVELSSDRSIEESSEGAS